LDFFARQAAARGHTRALVAGFFVCLLIVALALDLVLFSFLASASANRILLTPLSYARGHPGPAVVSTLLVMGILGLASLYKSMALRGGGGVVARDLGGVLVAQDTTDIRRKRLLNVVAEMSIASGVPMPEVYVLEQESAINAFAAGHTPANAAVTVTQGALDRLTREQLQGVIGHEFSHILNGDMRLNVQLMGWVFGLFVVAFIGRLILDFSPRNRRGNNGILALGFAVMALGYVGLFLGRIMQAAVSRQRERLADASGVQFTRNPQGLKEALVKIATTTEGSLLGTPHAEQAAHMFFAPALQRIFATHPPILERIRELDPQFDERQLAQLAQQVAAEGDVGSMSAQQFATGADVGSMSGQAVPGVATLGPAAQPAGYGGGSLATGTSAGTPGRPGGTGGLVPPAWPAASPAAPGQAAFAKEVATAGRLDPARIQQAREVHQALPNGLQDFMQSPARAQAFVLALLLSKDAAVRDSQLAILGRSPGAADVGAIQQATLTTDSLERRLRLPALQLLFPTLRRVPIAQRQSLARMASDLIYADSVIDVFEFCLAKLLEMLLTDELTASVPHGTLTLEVVQDEVQVLLAALAQAGATDEHNARIAFEAGISSVLPMKGAEYHALGEDWPVQLGRALARLEQLDPRAKKLLVDALVKTITSDEVMTEDESELLRTVCAVLHVPLPLMSESG
jgi:Zn-dependent protease with chaperone function